MFIAFDWAAWKKSIQREEEREGEKRKGKQKKQRREKENQILGGHTFVLTKVMTCRSMIYPHKAKSILKFRYLSVPAPDYGCISLQYLSPHWLNLKTPACMVFHCVHGENRASWQCNDSRALNVGFLCDHLTQHKTSSFIFIHPLSYVDCDAHSHCLPNENKRQVSWCCRHLVSLNLPIVL